MVNTAIVGCNGKMGCFVAQAVQSREDCNVLFGVDAFGESNYDFDVFKTFDEATETPDVIIDFYAMYNAYQSSLTAASKANSQTLLDYL